MARPFLSARWTDLCLFSYEVPRSLIEPMTPAGLELDRLPTTPLDRALVSLVAFDFRDTRVKGVRWPGHVNFPEINLRFYVRTREPSPRRGVVFIRELVPKPAVSILARAIYGEPYVTLPMRSSVTTTPTGTTAVEHRFTARSGRTMSIRAEGSPEVSTPDENSVEHWFKEHQWGFSRSRSGATSVYEVIHPVWAIRKVDSWSLELDWVAVYGEPWGILQDTKPVSVVMAVGSTVEVYPKGNLKDSTAVSR